MRNCRGQAVIIEGVVGLIVIVGVALTFLDLVAISLANQNLDELVHEAARAAATQTDGTSAHTVVSNMGQQSLGWITSATLTVTWPGTPTISPVLVNAVISVRLPVPLPFVGQDAIRFQAQDAEPVTAVNP